MQSSVLFSVLRVVGYGVVLLMAAAIIYASVIGVANWTGIGV